MELQNLHAIYTEEKVHVRETLSNNFYLKNWDIQVIPLKFLKNERNKMNGKIFTTSLPSMIIWDCQWKLYDICKNRAHDLWNFINNVQSALYRGCILDVNYYQIVIISYQLRDKGLLYGDTVSNCLEVKYAM